jgi:hypothetical protein
MTVEVFCLFVPLVEILLGGKRKAKALPSKAIAEHYRHIKYTQLNSDVFIGTLTVDWTQMRDEYEHSKKVAGNQDVSIYETVLTLRHFERLVGRCSSKQITQNAIDKFILQRGREVKRSTLNKDIRNFRAFINWCRENRYVNGEVKLKLLKEDERPVKSLTHTQIKKLLRSIQMLILFCVMRRIRYRSRIGYTYLPDDFKTYLRRHWFFFDSLSRLMWLLEAIQHLDYA